MKKKGILFTLLFLFLLVLSFVVFYFFKKDVQVSLKDELTVLLNADVTNLFFIEKLENGSIVSGEEKIDTSILGKKKITIQVKNTFSQVSEISFEIEIKDTEKPVITAPTEIVVTEGNTKNLLDGVEVKDNSNEMITAKIEGDYDLKKVGTYSLFYVAVDSSGNESKQEVTLKVIAKKTTTNSNQVTTTFTTSKGFSGVVKNGVTYIDGILVANKTYSLPSTYGSSLTKETMSAFNEMKNAASKDGLNIYISSGYRSYARQKTLYNNYVARDGKAAADTYSARPGHSEHQTGLAFDVNTISSAFHNTKEAKWLANNCYKYGFILRYPKGKEKETGYIYESWHFRYVGEELATKLYNNGDWITLESYFGITSEY